jgi:hypothetical protein
MSRSLAPIILGLIAIAGSALADNRLPVSDPLPPGILTSSDQSDEWKIKNALSAAPAVIAERAAVMDWPTDPKSGPGRMLRKGSNGWTCMPDLPGKPAHDPMCADETMMKWLTATFAGRPPNIDRVGMAYMLLGEAGADQNDVSAKTPPKGKDWYYVGPHVMIVLPDADKTALEGINHDISKSEPYVTALNSSSPLLVVPIARPGERVTVQKAEDKP